MTSQDVAGVSGIEAISGTISHHFKITCGVLCNLPAPLRQKRRASNKESRARMVTLSRLSVDNICEHPGVIVSMHS